MSSLLRLALLVLLNKICALDTSDTEVILLPEWNPRGTSKISLTFTVFGELVRLNLHRNDRIISPQLQVWKHNEEGVVEELSQLNAPDPCYYLHKDRFGSAAINFCQKHGLHGLVFLENSTLEITPLQDALESPSSSLVDESRSLERRADVSYGKRHVIRRSPRHPTDSDLVPKLRLIRTMKEKLTLELAMVFDEVAYRLFSPFLDGDDEKMRDMLLAYVNGIQALYHHPSLGVPIDISLVRLDIVQRQPPDLPHYNGESSNLLRSFCDYMTVRNPPEDDDPRHWDLGLYVTGLDLYVSKNNMKNRDVMGLAFVNGVCSPHHSGVILELGVTDLLGKPYPSAGFTSIYIAAHEIGHSLGMYHDASNNACPKDKYIMSPSRGVHGKMVWSKCSRDLVETLPQMKVCLLDRSDMWNVSDKYNHTQYGNLPGKVWTAKKQCEFLLRDKDANVVMLQQMCYSLQCETPHKSGYYLAGPALDGTRCAPGKECRGGECVSILEPPDVMDQDGKSSWSKWTEGPCSSGCLERSMGARIRRRSCENRNGQATDCKGLHYDVQLCTDEKLCRKKRRRTNEEFATSMCGIFSEQLPEVDGAAKGLQMTYEVNRPWIACAIFCQRKDITAYYSPRVELNDLNYNPYFPDGTWCHAEAGQNYYCRQHKCLSERFRFAKKLPVSYRYRDEDPEELGPQNARGHSRVDDWYVKYLMPSPNGLPLLTSVSRSFTFSPDEDDEWSDEDYIEIPESEASSFD